VTHPAKNSKRDGDRRSSQSSLVHPFLKWPGGKRWLVPTLLDIIGKREYETYREPFLGGAALFFALRPKRSVLSDINPELINTYRQVKNQARILLSRLREMPVDQPTYDRFREEEAGASLDRAIRFLYLNRTAFGGMYRLNQEGRFNVPFGGGERTTAPLWEYNLLRTAARALRSAQLQVIDFEGALSAAVEGDFVYCDPTYTVAHNNNGFIRYNERNFSWDDQKRLARCCHDTALRGATVVVSNAYHGEVLRLFAPPVHMVVSRPSRLCPQIEHRRTVEEFLFIFPAAANVETLKRAAKRGAREK
jgi:DNA adenine methylase